MDKDNKQMIKYLGLIFLALILIYRLPYRPYSIMQYLVPPIKIGNNSRLYLSGLIPLILFIIGVRGIFALNKYKYKNKLFVFLGIIIIAIPLMNYILDVSRTTYHGLKDDGLKAIDIEESSIALSSSEDETTIDMNLDLKDYRRTENRFRIRVYLPKDMFNSTVEKYYELENDYFTYGARDTINIEELLIIESNDRGLENGAFYSEWVEEDVEYELYNEKEKVRLVQPKF